MTTILNVFDKYQRVARVYPAIIILVPAIVGAVTTIPTLPTQTWTAHAVTVAVLLALLFALTNIVRMCGRNVEQSLWNSWGGPPSTRMLLWSDRSDDQHHVSGWPHDHHPAPWYCPKCLSQDVDDRPEGENA